MYNVRFHVLFLLSLYIFLSICLLFFFFALYLYIIVSVAGNYLQSLDWRNNPDIMKHIINFYTKVYAKADFLLLL